MKGKWSQRAEILVTFDENPGVSFEVSNNEKGMFTAMPLSSKYDRLIAQIAMLRVVEELVTPEDRVKLVSVEVKLLMELNKMENAPSHSGKRRL